MNTSPRPHPLTLALACALAATVPAGLSRAQSLPTGATVVRGQASIVTQGNQLTVTNSSNAVLNWQSFSIGAGQSVHFQQPSASSQVLNRVLGRDPSQLAGRLSSNGGVWLLNPYGVIFGRDARVDVAGLVASTLNISDADWQARRFSLLGGNTTMGSVVNQGEIRTTLGGQVMLVGGAAGVRNEGLIEAPGGQVLLAAGASVDLADSRSPNLAVRVSAPAGEAVNLGRLLAPGGKVDLHAAMVNQQGIVRADSLSGGPGGAVRLTAESSLTLASGSVTSADGPQGGRVSMQGGTTLVSGTVSAAGSQGQGGSVRLLGTEVGLLAGADVNASGRTGGGDVLVGGSLQGLDPSVPAARAVYMDANATVRADAGTAGPGGLIVLWSDQATRAYGSLSARGGAQGGDGGLIETSGGWLSAQPKSIRTDAPRGLAGTWLLDPNDILITDFSASDLHVTGNPNFRSTNDSATINTATIVAALETGNSVTVTTASAGTNSQPGTITMQGGLNLGSGSSTSPVGLTLRAARHIDLDHVNITSSSVPLNVTLTAGTGGAGGVKIIGSTISTSGNISVGGPSTACGTAGCSTFAGATGTTESGRGFGIAITGSTLSASRITLRGASAADAEFHGGVRVDSSSRLSASQIDIAGWTGSAAQSDQYGVRVEGSLEAVDRLTIDGTSRINGSGGAEGTAMGVYLDSSSSVLVGPTAIDGFSGFFALGQPRATRHALAADPNRYLRITAKSDARSGLATESIKVSGSVWVTDKAGISLKGDGGDVLVDSGAFDSTEAGNLLISGSSRLYLLADDLFVPDGEPTRLTNSQGVVIGNSLFGTPSEFLVDSASGVAQLGNGFGTVNLGLGSAPLTLRGTAALIGVDGETIDVQAGRIRIQAPTVEIGTAATLHSSATGDAITVTGRTGNVTTFISSNGSGSPFGTPNGRWLVWASDPTDGSNFQPNGLAGAIDFTQYNAKSGSAAVQGTGNGLLFTLAPQLGVSASLSGSANKNYDGTNSSSATLSGPGITGLLPGDSVVSTPSFGAVRYSSANAGSSIPLLVSLKGAPLEIVDSLERPVYGYRFTGALDGLYGSISPRTLTIVNLPAFDKVYDGTASVGVQGATLSGMAGGESLTLLPGTVAFNNPNAGLAKPVSGTLELADGPGGNSRNYRLAGGGVVDTTADIAPRPVTLSGATVADKVYDGTVAATIATGTLVGLVGTQTLKVSAGSTRFDNKNAGIGKAVSGSIVLDDGSNGGLASNYALTNGSTLALTGNILPRPVTLPGSSVADKFYDGNTVATVTAGPLQGTLPGESISARVDGRFETSAAGIDKPVFASVTLVDGPAGLASNYSFAGGGFAARASIQRRPVTVTGVQAADKTYDGTTAASLTAQAFEGLVPGETLTLDGLAAFDSPTVGTAKTVTGRIALADGGASASNYVLSNPGDFSGKAAINRRGLTVVGASAADKVYDGTTVVAVSNFSLQGALPGEQVTVSEGSGRFDDPNVGTGKPVTATATALSGADAANYSLTAPSVQTRAGISPATLTYVATPARADQGLPLPPLTGGFVGLVPGDTATSAVSGQLSFTTTATPSSPEGLYPIAGAGLVARNYVFTQDPRNGTALSVVRASTTPGGGPTSPDGGPTTPGGGPTTPGGGPTTPGGGPTTPGGVSTSTFGEPTSTVPTVATLLAALQPTPVVTSVAAHRVLDALPALQSAPPGFVFQPIDLDGTADKDVASLLAARDRYKKGIFADAIRDLEKNPGAADAPSCQTVEQAAAGNCLITEALKPALRARLQIEQQSAQAPAPAAPTGSPPPAATQPQAPAMAPSVPAPPSVAAAPAPAPAPSIAPALAPAPAAAARVAARPTTVAAPLRLPLARTVRTAALPQIQRKWALLIGTDIYEDSKIPQLDNAVSDVDAVARVLEDKLGYQTLVVRNGSKAGILRAFNQLAAAVSPADSVAIYYAGHGELVEKIGLGFWQPSDADASRAETWISNTDIGKLLGQLGASQVVLVSDSCFSGSLVSDERIRAGARAPDAAALLSRRAAVIMSSGGNEPVFDSGKNGHSTFAWSFMRALENVATWRPGSNVFEQVRFAVARQVPQRPQYGASKLGGHQSGADYVFEQRQLDTLSK